MARAAVLVVDDDAAVRNFVATVLQIEDYAVTTATNGREALLLIAQHRYDLVVSNMGMPVLDGPGLYRELRQQAGGSVPPFLFITGDHEKPDYARFFAEAGVRSLSKPFSQSALIQAVGQLLGTE